MATSGLIDVIKMTDGPTEALNLINSHIYSLAVNMNDQMWQAIMAEVDDIQKMAPENETVKAMALLMTALSMVRAHAVVVHEKGAQVGDVVVVDMYK